MTTVLIVDDHPIVLQGCRRMLQDVGVSEIIEARDTAAGYRLFSEHGVGFSPCAPTEITALQSKPSFRDV